MIVTCLGYSHSCLWSSSITVSPLTIRLPISKFRIAFNHCYIILWYLCCNCSSNKCLLQEQPHRQREMEGKGYSGPSRPTAAASCTCSLLGELPAAACRRAVHGERHCCHTCAHKTLSLGACRGLQLAHPALPVANFADCQPLSANRSRFILACQLHRNELFLSQISLQLAAPSVVNP
jgi:hypothetical protein